MKTQAIIRNGLVALALIIGTALYAQPGPTAGRGQGPCGAGMGPGGTGMGPGGAGMQQYRQFANCPLLDLSEEQKTQMQELRLEHYKSMKPLKNEMIELKAKEHSLISAEETDMKALNKVIDEQTALLNKMKKLQAEHRIEGKKVLTEEQQMLLEQRRSKRANMRAFRGQQHGRGYDYPGKYGRGQGQGRRL